MATSRDVVINMHTLSEDPFDLLPNEVALIPIKMAMRSVNEESEFGRHDFLVDVIAKVSEQFKTLAKVKSLWTGEVWIEGDREKIRFVIREFLGDGVTHLHLRGVHGDNEAGRHGIPFLYLSATFTTISGKDLSAIAKHCPNLRTLSLSDNMGLSYWPTLSAPWTSLTVLKLGGLQLSPKMFCGVKLHHSLPNLEIFETRPNYDFTRVQYLPDMSGCRSLERVLLGSGDFVVAGLPRTLKILDGNGPNGIGTRTGVGKTHIHIHMKRITFEGHFEDCRVDPNIHFCYHCHCRDIYWLIFSCGFIFFVISLIIIVTFVNE